MAQLTKPRDKHARLVLDIWEEMISCVCVCTCTSLRQPSGRKRSATYRPLMQIRVHGCAPGVCGAARPHDVRKDGARWHVGVVASALSVATFGNAAGDGVSSKGAQTDAAVCGGAGLFPNIVCSSEEILKLPMHWKYFSALVVCLPLPLVPQRTPRSDVWNSAQDTHNIAWVLVWGQTPSFCHCWSLRSTLLLQLLAAYYDTKLHRSQSEKSWC